MHAAEAQSEDSGPQMFRVGSCFGVICLFPLVSSLLVKAVAVDESVCARALASPETCHTSPAGVSHYMTVKCVKTCRETTLLFFALRPNVRVSPLLQASHTPPSCCHVFHFLQSKVTRSAAPPMVQYCGLACSLYQRPPDVWSGLF